MPVTSRSGSQEHPERRPKRSCFELKGRKPMVGRVALAVILDPTSRVGPRRPGTVEFSLWLACSRLLTMLGLGRRIPLFESECWSDSQSAALSRAGARPRAAYEPAACRAKRQANCDVAFKRVAPWPLFRHCRLLESYGYFRSRHSGAGFAVIRAGVRDVTLLASLRQNGGGAPSKAAEAGAYFVGGRGAEGRSG